MGDNKGPFLAGDLRVSAEWREIHRLRAALEAQRRAWEEEKRRLAKATKALEPFAALYDEVAEDFPDEVAHAMFATEFGHLRAAADALAAIREVPNG